MQLKSLYNDLIGQNKQILRSTDWREKRTYGDWLAQTYYFVLHSTRLLTLSAAHCEKEDEDFHSRLIEHTSEEKGHEILALKDLQALGFQLSDFQESPATSAFYQTQYYQIQHIDPLAFFGYILCLEGLAVEAGQHIYDQAKSSYGAQCSRFLKIHVGEDPEHLTKAFQSIENLSATRLKNIETSLKLSFSLYGGIIRSLETSNQQQQNVA